MIFYFIDAICAQFHKELINRGKKKDTSTLKRARLSFQPYAQLSATTGCKRSTELPSKNAISAFGVLKKMENYL